MKVLKGIQKLGHLNETSIIIDWDYLIRERGLRKEIDGLQKALGVLLRLISISGLLAALVIDFTLGNFLPLEAFYPERIIELIFWALIFVFLYSLYLLRDRTKFFDTLEIKTLDNLRDLETDEKLPLEIEITDYFDYDLLYILDDIVRVGDREFLTSLLKELVKLPRIQPIIMRMGLDRAKFEEVIKKTYLEMNTSQDTWMVRMMFESFTLAYKNSFETVDERALFLTICKIAIRDVLLDFEVLPNEIEGLLLWVKNEANKERYRKLWKEKASLKPKNTVNRAYTSVLASTLERFKKDFTLDAIMGNVTLSVARDKELDYLVRLLHQGQKGAVLLKGEPGVGKTQVIKSLALRMVVEDVPRELYDKRLIGFDFNKAYAIAHSADKFKAEMEKIFEEVARAKNIILVFDDIDQLVNVRGGLSGEIVSQLIDAITKYNLRIIATAGERGYQSVIKPNKALANLFDIVEINEPTHEVAVQILLDMVAPIERRYGVRISLDAIKTTVSLAPKYAFDRVLPEKAIDLLEEAAVYARSKRLEFISEKEIEEVVSQKVGVNVGIISDEEQSKLLHLEQEMHRRVVGQDAAVEAIADALRRARAGLTSGSRPIASFLFFGPTGVGKTEVAKTLAEVYYGHEDKMVRLDMSEYQEDENLKRLIGYQQGDDFFGGYLTEGVREKPFSLILLDEIEKANSRVLDIFLQILDEGEIKDGMGRKVSFANTIIVATSNAGSRKIAELLGKGAPYKQVYKEVSPVLREIFRVEFLNRFDQLIMFKPLTQIDMEEIAGIMLNNMVKKIYEQGIMVDFSVRVVRELAAKGYNPSFGARELRRVIQDTIENQIAELIVAKKLTAGKRLIINSMEDFQIEEN